MYKNIGSYAIVRRNTRVLGQFPGPGGVTRGFCSQRTDRTNIDHITRQFRGYGFFDKGADFDALAPAGKTQFWQPGNFITKTNATCAMNTAGEIGGDQGSDIFVHYHALLLGILRNAFAKPHRHILKLAFATLITNRAIERMVDQQEFHRRLLRCNRCSRSSLHNHAVDHICGTGRHRFR
ncbi:hypothetical protein MnTg03_01296 [bacterium MnTg03]|nr:hypothetical protein MnTg03_01296 [bacterium MnTg03]